jgi:hypothetical protein
MSLVTVFQATNKAHSIRYPNFAARIRHLIGVKNNSVDKLKIVSDIAATWVAIVGVLFSGAFGLVEYHNNSRAERVKTTIALSERFGRDQYLIARMKIDAYGAENASELFTRSAKGSAVLSQYILGVVGKSGLGPEIDIVVEFFDELHACTCGGACDEEMARRLFGRFSALTHSNFYPYIALQREQLRSKDYGIGIEAFTKAYRRNSDVCVLLR